MRSAPHHLAPVLPVPQAQQQRVIQIHNKNANALDGIEKGILNCLSGVSIGTFVLVKQVLFVVLVKRTNADSFSDTKGETRVAAYMWHDKYSELFPQRAARVLERMNRQQLRVVREPEQPEQGGGAEGEDKDKKADAPKRKQRISSVSPERKAGAHFTCFTSTRVQILTRIPPPDDRARRLHVCHMRE